MEFVETFVKDIMVKDPWFTRLQTVKSKQHVSVGQPSQKRQA